MKAKNAKKTYNTSNIKIIFVKIDITRNFSLE